MFFGWVYLAFLENRFLGLAALLRQIVSTILEAGD
jgi:hypothetical protein